MKTEQVQAKGSAPQDASSFQTRQMQSHFGRNNPIKPDICPHFFTGGVNAQGCALKSSF